MIRVKRITIEKQKQRKLEIKEEHSQVTQTLVATIITMVSKDTEIGMKVFYQGDKTYTGIIVKLKPIVAVLEVYNELDGDIEIHEIS